MEEVIDILIDDNINIDTVSYLSQNTITVTHLIDEYLDNNIYILNKKCDYLTGFYAFEECIFTLTLKNTDGSEVTFYYKLEPNKVFYALDNKFMIPCLQLYDCNIIIKLIKGNPKNISILRLSDIENNDKNTIFYCKISINYYLLYSKGKVRIQDRSFYNITTETELHNIRIYKFMKDEELSTHMLSYSED